MKSALSMIDSLVKWGNTCEVIADEAGIDVRHVRAVLYERTSSLMPPSCHEALALAYENLYPLSYLELPAAPLLRHRDAIYEVLGSGPTIRKRLERAEESGVVTYTLADDMLTRIGLPVELVYGRTDIAAGAAA